MRLSYRKKLFFYFLIVFAVFAAIVVFVQQNRERTFRNDEFKRGMDVYATLISKYIAENHLTAPDSMSRLDSLLPLLPRDLRISIIDRRGNVLFDNGSDGKPIVENHLSRPEIAQALIRGGGSHIRHSATTGKTYYYYARLFGNDFVRVALPYDNAAKLSLKADDFFLYFMLLLFFVALISLLYLSDRFGKAVSGLRDFLVSTENNRPDFDKVRFPDTELGEIGNRIVTNYRLLRESRNLLDTEREKLIRHFHYSDEGICIFSPDGDKIYANSHFIQHLNTILDEPTSDATAILRAKDFGDLREFLQRHRPVNPQSASIPIYETKLTREGRHFAVRLLIFNDNSFEITLDNITAQEKNRLLKQEMTNNIAHELKTPVTSIRGYLETLLQQHEISPDKQRFFLDRAYTQALRLSDLIRDVALITKIEEATDLFERKPVDLKQVVEEVIADHKNTLDAHRVQIVDRISRGTTAAHIARAALEGIAYQTLDIVGAMQRDAGVSLVELKVDGGAARNDLLMQFQADLLATKVIRPRVTETTALGAAYLAGLAVGYWESVGEIRKQWQAEHIFEPAADRTQIAKAVAGWEDAVRRVLREKND